MIKRAQYRKEREEHLFNQVIEWSREENEPVLVEIAERAWADDNAENWLTLHPNSSFTGLMEHYFTVVTEEKEMLGSEKRLLKKTLDGYYKRLAA